LAPPKESSKHLSTKQAKAPAVFYMLGAFSI